MKRRLFIFALIVAAFGGVSFLCSISYRAGQHRSLGLQKGTFVGTLDALERIRKGDIEGGTHRIESLCFASAAILLADDSYKSNSTVHALTSSLVDYRKNYRTNVTDWTPMEQRLENLLAQPQ